MKKIWSALAVIPLLAAVDTSATQISGDGTQAGQVRPATPSATIPKSESARIQGIIDAVEPASGTVHLKNGVVFKLGKYSQIFSGSESATRYELRPGTIVAADINLKTQEASHVWIKK
jgi:hypothetical protein